MARNLQVGCHVAIFHAKDAEHTERHQSHDDKDDNANVSQSCVDALAKVGSDTLDGAAKVVEGSLSLGDSASEILASSFDKAGDE